MAKKLTYTAPENIPQSVALSDLRGMVTKRDNHEALAKETAKALALYFGKDHLDPYIDAFGPNEGTKKLTWRRTITKPNYHNYVAGIASTYTEGVLRTGLVSRSTGVTTVDAFLGAQYADWFESDFAWAMLTLPEIFVGISVPQAAPTVETRQDELDADLWPTPYVIYPQHVINFEQDASGDLKWCTVDCGGGRFKVYTDTEVITCDGSGAVLSVALHGWDECPILRFVWRENTAYQGKPIGQAFLSEVIENTYGNLQSQSQLIELCWLHLNMKLVTSKQVAKSLVENGIGNSRTLIEEPGPDGKAGQVTRYLTMPVDTIDKLIDIVYSKNPEAIFRAARLVDRSATTVQSGIAKLLDMAPETAVISKISQRFERADREILTLLTARLPVAGAKVEITYPSTFDLKSPHEIAMDLVTASKMHSDSGLPRSAEGDAEIAIKYYESLMVNWTDKTRASVAAALREWAANMAKDGDAVITAQPTSVRETLTGPIDPTAPPPVVTPPVQSIDANAVS